MFLGEKELQKIFESACHAALSFDVPICILDTNIVLDLFYLKIAL